MKLLVWSKSKPMNPGWYFWRYNNSAGAGIVRVCWLNSKLWVDGDSLGRGMLEDWTGQWAGPIEPPETKAKTA